MNQACMNFGSISENPHFAPSKAATTALFGFASPASLTIATIPSSNDFVSHVPDGPAEPL
jgi:hypothetical protein